MRGSGVGETRRRHGFSNKPLQCLKGHQMLGAPPQHQLSQAWCRENRDGGLCYNGKGGVLSTPGAGVFARDTSPCLWAGK